MSQVKRKKLYFDFELGTLAGEAGTLTRRIFPCTQYPTATGPTPGSQPGDRYGNLLDALEALTATSPNSMKSRRAVRAYVNLRSSTATSAKAFPISVDFIEPTNGLLTNTAAVVLIDNPVLGSVYDGTDAIYGTTGNIRHFAVLVRTGGNAVVSADIVGTLFVDRQHDIEV
jgi:hypothetical protein